MLTGFREIRLREGCVETGGSRRAKARQDVAVRVKGDPDARVAEPLRHDLRVDALAEQEAGASVAT
jgi:hypothetical protein